MTDDERSATHATAGAPGASLREAEWGRRLAALVLGWTAFETLSGLSLWLLPFSVPNEWMVLVHTGAGLLFLLPALVYQARHLAVYWSRPVAAITRPATIEMTIDVSDAGKNRKPTSAGLRPVSVCM